MKKLNLLLVLVLSLGVVISTAGISRAAVSGPCVSCHTMHNMQDGVVVDPNGPNDYLTRNSCLGCHGQAGPVVEDAPNVFATEADMPAGGTFRTTEFTDNTYVHNVTDIEWTGGHIEDNITNTPGLASVETDQLSLVTPTNLNCAGVTGCHGDHDPNKTDSDKGIRGFHHGSVAYRYCQIGTGEGTPIEGVGSTDWEAGGADINDHNVYGADEDDGISSFCAQCHGDFHNEAGQTGDTGGVSPFKRHPTDNLLADAAGWDLSRVTIDYDNNPFAFKGIDITTQGIDNTTDYAANWDVALNLKDLARVACISCHRAHGSPYQDILRFDYSSQLAGSTTVNTGCLGCHEKQRGI